MSTRFPHAYQNETGSVRRKNNAAPAHPASSTFHLAIIPAADRLGAGSCQLRHGTRPACCARRPYTVCWILRRGRPEGGWKMWPAVRCRQTTPARFARIFRVCHISATIPSPALTFSTASASLAIISPTTARKPFSKPLRIFIVTKNPTIWH